MNEGISSALIFLAVCAVLILWSRHRTQHLDQASRAWAQEKTSNDSAAAAGIAGTLGRVPGPAEPVKIPVRDKTTSAAGGVCFALAALGMFLISRSLVREYALLKLPQTNGTMLSCEPVMAHTRRVGSSGVSAYWTVAARFAYSVNGTAFEGTRLSNLAPRTLAGNWHQADAPSASIVALCNKYYPGTKVQVRYRPGDPRISFVYFTSPLRDWPWVLFPLICGFSGWFFIFAARFAVK